MGRPPMPKNKQRQQLNIRLSAEEKSALIGRARANGRSLAAEAEARLAESLTIEATHDQQTRDLVAMILDQIVTIQADTKKRWHKDLMTWAATAQMLGHGPVRRFHPDKPHEDEIVRAAQEAMRKNADAKLRTLTVLRDHGISASWRPYRGISKTNALATMFPPAAEPTQSRFVEWSLIQGIDEDDRERLLEALAELLRLDDEETECITAYIAAMKPYSEAEAAGRKRYKDRFQYDDRPHPEWIDRHYAARARLLGEGGD